MTSLVVASETNLARVGLFLQLIKRHFDILVRIYIFGSVMTLLSQISYDFNVYDFFITSFFSFFGKFSCCLKSVRQRTFSLAHFLVKVVEYLKLILISAITDAMLPRKSFFSSWLKNVFRIAKSCIQKVFCLLKYVFYFMINLLSREGGDTSNGIFVI